MNVRCAIAGGGPAGMMLGFLLARAGIEVAVVEKHADFFRDFRGDTIHPSTLQLMYELGLLDAFLARPHNELTQLTGSIDDRLVTIADFSRLPTHSKFIALMPQWDFLDFLAEQGKKYAGFRVMMQADVTELLRDGERISGVRAQTPDGPVEIKADLVVGADGRSSTVRALSGLTVEDFGAPMDVLWMRISRDPNGPRQTFGNIRDGRLLVSLDRGDYWQVAFVIAKGTFPELQTAGIDALRRMMVATAPFLSDRINEIQDWTQVSLLTVKIDRLAKWYRDGLLCIGDASHAMSPIGGVGINLAIQDAVASANLLAAPLRDGTLDTNDLREVQRRREFPAKVIQRGQIFVQERLVKRVLTGGAISKLPLVLRLLQHVPPLQSIPAYIVGVGVRPEHVRTPEVLPG
ncbi:MAG TPA: FAD-dependent oxidoreductase [Verrucomicrobiae bacterium]|nr:FAD-dependent oxidoreductase [Verrucomicrobiae bacterium]